MSVFGSGAAFGGGGGDSGGGGFGAGGGGGGGGGGFGGGKGGGGGGFGGGKGGGLGGGGKGADAAMKRSSTTGPLGGGDTKRGRGVGGSASAYDPKHQASWDESWRNPWGGGGDESWGGEWGGRGVSKGRGAGKGRGEKGGRGGGSNVCYYFMQGNCRNGDACTFEHPGKELAPAISKRDWGKPAEAPATPAMSRSTTKLEWVAPPSQETPKPIGAPSTSAAKPAASAKATPPAKAAPAAAGGSLAARLGAKPAATTPIAVEQEEHEWEGEGEWGGEEEWWGEDGEGEWEGEGDWEGEEGEGEWAGEEGEEGEDDEEGEAADDDASGVQPRSLTDAMAGAVSETPAGSKRALPPAPAPAPAASSGGDEARAILMKRQSTGLVDAAAGGEPKRMRQAPAAAPASAFASTMAIKASGGADKLDARRDRFTVASATPVVAPAPISAARSAPTARRSVEARPGGAPYSWSVMDFPPSTDHGPGPGQRNFADGGGWGRCRGMCPPKEMKIRNESKQYSMHELDLETGEPRADWLVNGFHRNDAAKVWEPEDIRTIGALAASVEHLVVHVFQRRFVTSTGAPCPNVRGLLKDAPNWPGGEPPIYEVERFVRDRMRGIRAELTMQIPSFSVPAKLCCVDLFEVSSRYHIMVEHRCCELGTSNLVLNEVKFNSKMNMDMFTQGLAGVIGLYDELRADGISCANEAEFRAYYIMSSADPEAVSGKLRGLPTAIVNAPQMQRALRVLASVQNNDPVAFFRELRSADYFAACLMHRHLETVQDRALQAINRACFPSGEMPLADLQRMLCMEPGKVGEEQARTLVELNSMQLTPDGRSVVLSKRGLERRRDAEGHVIPVPLVQLALIEEKSRHLSLPQLLYSPVSPPILQPGGETAAAAAAEEARQAAVQAEAQRAAAAASARKQEQAAADAERARKAEELRTKQQAAAAEKRSAQAAAAAEERAKKAAEAAAVPAAAKEDTPQQKPAAEAKAQDNTKGPTTELPKPTAAPSVASLFPAPAASMFPAATPAAAPAAAGSAAADSAAAAPSPFAALFPPASTAAQPELMPPPPARPPSSTSSLFKLPTSEPGPSAPTPSAAAPAMPAMPAAPVAKPWSCRLGPDLDIEDAGVQAIAFDLRVARRAADAELAKLLDAVVGMAARDEAQEALQQRYEGWLDEGRKPAHPAWLDQLAHGGGASCTLFLRLHAWRRVVADAKKRRVDFASKSAEQRLAAFGRSAVEGAAALSALVTQPPQLKGWAGGSVGGGRIARWTAQLRARLRADPSPATAAPASLAPAAAPTKQLLLLAEVDYAGELPSTRLAAPPPALAGWSHGTDLRRRQQQKQRDDAREAALVSAAALPATPPPANAVVAADDAMAIAKSASPATRSPLNELQPTDAGRISARGGALEALRLALGGAWKAADEAATAVQSYARGDDMEVEPASAATQLEGEVQALRQRQRQLDQMLTRQMRV